MRRFFQGVIFCLLWGLLLGGGYVAYEAHIFLTTPASATAEEVLFSIAPGATFDRVAWDLKKAGLISDVFRFRLLAQYHSALGKIKAGEFALNTGWTPEQVLRQITQGQAVLYKLSVREGLSWWETAQAVEEQGFARFEDFKAVIHDPDFLRAHHIPFANAEGFLYPETYLLKKPRAPLDKKQAREVADIMVDMFWEKTKPLWSELPQKAQAPASWQGGVPVLPQRPGAMRSPPPSVLPKREPALPESNATRAVPAPPPAQPHPRPSVPETSAQAQPPQAQSPQDQPRPDAESQEPLAKNGSAGIVRQTILQFPLNATIPGPGRNASEGLDSPAAAARGANASIPSVAHNASIPAAFPNTPADAAGQGGQRVEPADIEPDALKKFVILASLVEKETGVPDERPRVAGVYVNRLRLKMLLQCDPTIIYGLGPSFSGAIKRSQIDDPKNLYNTYQHPGLPPGPICSAGIASLEAAAHPEKHDFLYFVATGLDARHTFTKNLAEHNKAVQLYRARTQGGKK